MELQKLKGEFAVCSLEREPANQAEKQFWFYSRTDREVSLVCRSEDIPQEAARSETGWTCFRVAGTLDFSLVGILAKISSLLAGAGIPVFVVSTFQTDYIFIKKEHDRKACSVLSENGWQVTEQEV